MGLRKDFLVHKNRTIESFKLVRSDVSGINTNIDQLKNTLASVELSISSLGGEMLSLKTSLDKCISDVSMQQMGNLNLMAKIDIVSKSIGEMVDNISTFRNKIENILSKNSGLSRQIDSQGNSIKKLLPKSSKQSLEIRKLNSALKKSQQDIKKLRKLMDRKLKTAKRADKEIESTVKSQRKRIVQLNKKVDSKKPVGKRVIKKIVAKTVKKKITVKKPRKTFKKSPKKTAKKMPKISVKRRRSQGKTIVTVKTPDRTLVEAVTPSKGGNVKVVRGRNPLF